MSNKTINLVEHRTSKDSHAQREYRANQYIRLMGRNFWASSYDRMFIMLDAPLEEKEAYVRASKRRVMKWVAVVGLIFLGFTIYRYFVPAPIPPAPPLPTFEGAGIVQDIQLHSTTFSIETTIKTSTGIFQVRGGVSASVGDAAQIKRVTSYGTVQPSLCIQSQIKTACYSML